MRSAIFIMAMVPVMLISCTKEEDPPTPLPGLPPAAHCGSEGARLTATFDGSAWCANMNLWASPAAGEITISGLTSLGSTLTLQIDSLAMGSYPMTEAANTILHTTSLGIAYMSTEGDPPVLHITAHDTVADRIQGTFTGNLYTTLSPGAKAISGSFDMDYQAE